MCAHLSATHIFRLRDRNSSQYVQVPIGFRRLNFDRDTRTGYGGRFRGYP